MRLDDIDDLAALPDALSDLPGFDEGAAEAARERQGALTKPPESLGRLEEVAVFVAGWRADPRPRIDRAQALVFAGNHGVCAQGVNPFPQAVTAAMVANFEAGGAAINQLCRTAGAELTALALDLDRPTADFTESPAMSEAECLAAIKRGAAAVDPEADILVLGEMGIGNSTVAAALACACLGGTARDWTGPGAGADEDRIRVKTLAVRKAVDLHYGLDPLSILAALGGREQAALVRRGAGRADAPHPGDPRRVHLHRRGAAAVRPGPGTAGPLPGRASQRRARPCADAGADRQGAAAAAGDVAGRGVRRGAGAGHREGGRRLPFGHGDLCRGGNRDAVTLARRRDELRLAVAMLTRLPVGRIDPAPPLSRAAWAFPLAGLAPGVAMWAVFAALGGGPGAWAACLAGALATGALHHDGLADFADGIGGGRDRAHALEIMRDSRVGSYGVLALVLGVGAMASAIAAAEPRLWEFLFVAVGSRWAMLAVMVGLPPAREDGLGRLAAGAGGLWPGAAAAAVLGLAVGPVALAMAAAGGGAAALLAGLARRRIGGQTGDVLGAVQLGAEVAAWVTLATLSG